MHYGLPMEGFELVNTVLTNGEACVFSPRRDSLECSEGEELECKYLRPLNKENHFDFSRIHPG